MKKNLSVRNFILSQVGILFIGLGCILYLNYLFNLSYTGTRLQSLGHGPLTSTPTVLTLEIVSPNDDTLTFQSSIVVSGNTRPDTPVLISTASRGLAVQSKFDGSFSVVLALTEGVNQIQITVFGPTGDQKSVNKTIYYSKDKI
ncbi:MAG: hypothetical protein Q7R49_02285 [Candidatus Daviesbacteria bacterium]|nr:hypothetical protein [Candidatus Daviesbacteria bacterium]